MTDIFSITGAITLEELSEFGFNPGATKGFHKIFSKIQARICIRIHSVSLKILLWTEDNCSLIVLSFVLFATEEQIKSHDR